MDVWLHRANYAPYGVYDDTPQPIGHSQTISAPHMHGFALQSLHKQILIPDANVLDVGCGSGYLTAVMARLNPTAKVIGIDIIRDLVTGSEVNIKKKDVDLLDSGHVKLYVKDGWKGCPEEGPYDAIHVGAGAGELPQELLKQLKPGGRMIVPVGSDGFQSLMQVDRLPEAAASTKGGIDMGDYSIVDLMDVRYVPLVRGR
jgi:protein-L-isoaspartate(D-aspartate) O-methyltransferase